jgi:tetrahydromethanopterin S-methyltransferase subunit F
MPTIQTFRTFVFLAPPIGWLVYATGMILGEAVQGDWLGTLSTGLLVIVIGAPFSYLFGLIPAALAAVLMVAGSSFAEVEAGPVFAGVVGLICGLIFAILFHREVDAAVLGGPVYFALKVLTCLVPTLICWWLVRQNRTDTSV